jgi:hypothetical protein
MRNIELSLGAGNQERWCTTYDASAEIQILKERGQWQRAGGQRKHNYLKEKQCLS